MFRGAHWRKNDRQPQLRHLTTTNISIINNHTILIHITSRRLNSSRHSLSRKDIVLPQVMMGNLYLGPMAGPYFTGRTQTRRLLRLVASFRISHESKTTGTWNAQARNDPPRWLPPLQRSALSGARTLEVRMDPSRRLMSGTAD